MGSSARPEPYGSARVASDSGCRRHFGSPPGRFLVDQEKRTSKATMFHQISEFTPVVPLPSTAAPEASRNPVGGRVAGKGRAGTGLEAKKT